MTTADRSVFISYCQADARWLDRLKIHLRPVIRSAALDLWDDSRIRPGEPWRDQIAGALRRARAAILLISADYLASDLVIQNELPPILHRAAHDGLLVVPLIAAPCLFREHEELSRYPCANSPEKPLSSMSPSDADASLVALARNVADYFRRLDSTATNVQMPASADSPTGAPGRVAEASHLPRSPYGPCVVGRPMNLGFDGPTEGGVPSGWFNSFGHVTGVSTDYTIEVLQRSRDPRDGTCVALRKPAAAWEEFGSLMQRCPGQFLAGKTVRLIGELRSEDVTGSGGLWLRADGEDRPNLFFDNMSGRPVLGTTSWTSYSIDAQIPAGTAWLNYGIVLSGPGALFADNLRLLVWTPGGRWEDA